MGIFPERERDKRTPAIMPDQYRPPGQRPSFDSLVQQISTLTATIDKLEKRIVELDKQVREGGYISRSEFNLALGAMVSKEGRYWLVERIVFGGVALILLAAMGAVMYTIGWAR